VMYAVVDQAIELQKEGEDFLTVFVKQYMSWHKDALLKRVQDEKR